MTLRVLITGGFGFIGGRLATYLHGTGQNIVVGSRHPKRTPLWLKDIIIKNIIWNDLTSLQQVCQGVDVIIQAAGMNAQDCASDPVAALEFNGLATTRLVSAASNSGVKKFIYLSTAHVYSNPLVGTITEKTYPKNFHPYATSHLAGEMAVLAACKEKKIQGLVLRISNAFGMPTDHKANCWNLLINDLCKQAVVNRKLHLISNGHQHRDFIPLGELCEIVGTFITDQINNERLGVFNIGSGKTKSVLNIARIIQNRCQKILGFKPTLECKKTVLKDNFPPLKYKTPRLKQRGFHHSNRNSIEEIDQLLKFCYLTYVNKRE